MDQGTAKLNYFPFVIINLIPLENTRISG